MPITKFICPDGNRIDIEKCLAEGGCKNRCATRSYLRMCANQREWTGKPSTTQLIAGTMQAYLKIVNDYAISPDSRAFMIIGTKAHANLESYDDEFSFLEEKFREGDVTGIADVYEQENSKGILVDYKTSGSYKIMRALGLYQKDEETGEVFKSGKRKGEKKTKKILYQSDEKIDRRDWVLQLNKYRMEFEKAGFPVHQLKIMAIARDGGTWMAKNRGVTKNINYFNIEIMPNVDVIEYFEQKKKALLKALSGGEVAMCTPSERWEDRMCQSYCDVAEFCEYGKHLKKEEEENGCNGNI